jgi:hypothetical protein
VGRPRVAWRRQLGRSPHTRSLVIAKFLMQEPIGDRIKQLRDEIAELSEADRKDKAVGQPALRRADHERRLERLEAIIAELKSLTDWKAL